jgi:transposase-like protein
MGRTKQSKNYTSSFKAQLVLEALKEEKTIAQIGSENDTHPRNIQLWKRQFLENVEVVFDQEMAVKKYQDKLQQEQEKIDFLHKQIGELTVALNWMKKKDESLTVKGKNKIN